MHDMQNCILDHAHYLVPHIYPHFIQLGSLLLIYNLMGTVLNQRWESLDQFLFFFLIVICQSTEPV